MNSYVERVDRIRFTKAQFGQPPSVNVINNVDHQEVTVSVDSFSIIRLINQLSEDEMRSIVEEYAESKGLKLIEDKPDDNIDNKVRVKK